MVIPIVPSSALTLAAATLLETINSQLALQFHVETNHAHSFRGLAARPHTMLTAHTLCVWLNRLLGVADMLPPQGACFPAQLAQLPSS